MSVPFSIGAVYFLKGTRYILKEFSDFSDSCPEFWPDDSSQNDLKHISGKVGDDTGSKSGAKGKVHLSCEPEGAKGITYREPRYHSGDSGGLFAGKAVHQETLDQRNEEKADQVSACGTGELPKSSSKTGKYREPCRAQDQINEHAGCAAFHPQHIHRDIDCKICEGEWDRADGKRDGKRSENAEHCGHETDQRQFFCSAL